MESRTFEAILDSVGRCYFKTRWGGRKKQRWKEGKKRREREKVLEEGHAHLRIEISWAW